MLWTTRSLLEYTLVAKDGAIGQAQDMIFEEPDWEVRYLLVDTQDTPPTPTTLIAAITLEQPNRQAHRVPLQLTKQQIENSPAISLESPIPKHEQDLLAQYYALFQYWAMSDYASSSFPLFPISADPPPISTQARLHTSGELLGTCIQGIDAKIGEIRDVLIEDSDWAIHYLVITPEDWIPAKQLVVPPSSLETIQWAQKDAVIEVDKETLQENLVFKPSPQELK